MSRPRIIHYISELDVGGTERQLLLLLPALQEYVDNHVVCAHGFGPIGPRLYQQGIPVHYLHGRHKFDPRPAFRLRQLVKHLQPDIMTTYLSYADLTGRLIAPAKQKPAVISSQRSSYYNQDYLRHLDRLTKHRVNHYVCQTNAAHQQLCRSHRLHSHQCTIIPNAVQVAQKSTTSPLRTQLGLTLSDIIITSVSTLKPGKGHADLIAAFAPIHADHPEAHLALVGDGPLREDLYHQAQSIAPHNIHFLGEQKDIPGILAASDIFALPTYGEGMSNALLEAMAAGLPIITTNIATNQELITHGATGLLCPPKDITCLTEHLKRLITQPNLRHQLGQNAHHQASTNHHLKTIARRWHQLYQDLLDND